MDKIDITKCRFYNNGCDSHVLCTGDDDIYGECYFKQVEKLKQKLKKTKEIASVIVYGTHFTNDIEGHLKELAKEILKITESKN